jgi:hypothetical protein
MPRLTVTSSLTRGSSCARNHGDLRNRRVPLEETIEDAGRAS